MLKRSCLFVIGGFLMFAAVVATAQQGQINFASGQGHVNYTYQYYYLQCGGGYYQEWVYTSLVYADPNGGQHSYSGGGAYFLSPGGPNCPPTGPSPVNGVVINDSGFVLNFIPGVNGNPSASIGFTGSVNPNYEVAAVYYAPPGSQSFADYSQTTMVGTSTSIENSFESSVSQSVTFGSTGGSIFGSGSYSATAGTSLSQVQDSSKSIDISYQQGQGYKIYGPTSDALGLYHPADQVAVWLNPQANLTLSTGAVKWTSYSWDSRDPARNIDVVYLTVYELQNPSWIEANYPTFYNNVLEKANWNPSGGLTSIDFSDIAAHDPYSNGNPSPDPTRYQGPVNGSTISYVGPGCPTCQPSAWYWNSNFQVTNSQGQQANKTSSLSFGITEKFSIFGDMLSASLQNSSTFTWTNKWSSTQSSKVTKAATVNIVGPAYGSGYNGPTQFNMYQDNIYGTYMFYPVQ
jgi:hypothetical protein